MDTFVDMVMYAIRINMYAAGEGLGWGRGGEGEGGEVEGREREAPKLLLNQGPSEPCYATACMVEDLPVQAVKLCCMQKVLIARLLSLCFIFLI